MRDRVAARARERLGPVVPADERDGDGADAEHAGDEAGGDRAREPEVASGGRVRRELFGQSCQSPLPPDDSALSPKMIRPFRENVSVWTKVRRPGFRTFRNCARHRKQASLGPCTISPDGAQRYSDREALAAAGRDPMTARRRRRQPRPRRRLRGPAPRLRAGRVGRPGPARGGAARRPGRPRPRARHPALLRHRPARRDARPRDRRPRRGGRSSSCEPPRARRAAPRRLPARVPRRHRRPRRGRRVGRAGQGRRAARRRAGQRRPAPRRARGPRARGGAAGARRRPRPRCAHSYPALDRRAVVRGARRRRRPRADGRRQPAGGGRRCAPTRCARRRRRWPPSCRSRAHPADGLPEGLVLEGAFDAFGSPLWEQGAFMPQSRAAMAVGRILAPGRASACSTCAPRRAARPRTWPR